MPQISACIGSALEVSTVTATWPMSKARAIRRCNSSTVLIVAWAARLNLALRASAARASASAFGV
ncbi:Uncharacterised protein [Mycobacterium tuberculosis]|nr:Uncharacterised protein [Mycobacterium tuberculosis]